VRAEIAELSAGTFLQDAPLYSVCASQAGDPGVAELKDYLHGEAQALRQRDSAGLFRLAVDRVFTLAGHGTVVTGTAH
ncbi:selenocysteinyl-tRNA-specific translation elongation factor SelB, partial [Klebsiella pneumoniae]|nr:selenocysteinyl-tRNA-specific translation elongation factor SelB [Klebsiella pneumoniae]